MAKKTQPFLCNISMVIAMLVFLLISSIGMQATAQTLCYSQFALANEACNFLRATTVEPRHENEQRRHHGDDDDDDGGEEGDDNGRDSACCRRLTGIDNACVCQVLARLPQFITKPKHAITLTPEKGCEVSFQCDGST